MANEKRLIDANFTKAVIQNYIANNEVTKAFVEIAGHICGMLDDCETVDAVEVVHGRWIMTLYTTTSKRGRVIANKKFACSVCGYHNGRKQSNYCPNCGAKMDGERKGND